VGLDAGFLFFGMALIRIRGARQHNLRNVDVDIPRDRLVVITGLSGSGKSSLAFDTLFAEGQRRYVESLSAYARQFLDRMQKPDVDFIEGLSPAIAIEQRSAGAGPRSTIATTTEIHDYLRVLYAAVGLPHDPATGRPVVRQSPQQIGDAIEALGDGARVVLCAPVVEGQSGEFRDVIERLRREGFVRARVDGEFVELGRTEPIRLEKKRRHTIEAVVDRLVVREGVRTRLADSIATALRWGEGRILVLWKPAGAGDPDPWTPVRFSTAYCAPETGFTLPELTPRHFSFNSHLGACPSCHGLGSELHCDPDLLVPDPDKSIRDGAVRAHAALGKRMAAWFQGRAEELAKAYGADLARPFRELPETFRAALVNGTANLPDAPAPFEGLVPQLERLERESESQFTKNRVRAFMTRRPCGACGGRRLKPAMLAVTLQAADRRAGIMDFCAFTVREAIAFAADLRLGDQETRIAAELLREIRNRLQFLDEVGLGYLTLDRESGTLSGGEAQRIRLATQIGSGLAGVIYVLDEPSIGLHQRDNERLLGTLRRLRDLGNSVIVVEHDEDTIRAADHILDLGPGAGPHGGEIVAQGTLEQVLQSERSLTARYLDGKLRIPVPRTRVAPRTARPVSEAEMRRAVDSGWLCVTGARENNLRNLSAAFPLGCLTCVTGVSGSGKSTLVDDILQRALFRRLYGSKDRPGKHDGIYGLDQIDKAIEIDQSPIGRTPRSNPATYTGAFGPIRDLFAQLPASRVRGYGPGRFSFNSPGGRCEHCQGDGMIRIEMHFLPDVYVECEVCRGRRFNRETLEITYKGRNIADILDLNVDEAAAFFRAVPALSDRMSALQRVGLGYLRLGQPATTLSGGEAQRVKLGTELARRATGRTVYLLDEPTTGLHFADIQRLLEVLLRLRDSGNTLIVIEHNLEVIKSADWVVDLGPEGGAAGGTIVATGTPEQIAGVEGSITGRYLKRMLA
jgi:excinuclease ABC subunit A